MLPAALVVPLLLALGGVNAVAQPLSGYTVLVETGASRDAAKAAIRSAGGTVVKENTAVGSISARGPQAGFIQQVTASEAVFGAARDFVLTESPEAAAGTSGTPTIASGGPEPLEEDQWGLRMVRADLARDKQLGDPRVYVGVMDTGIDGSHPDLGPRLNRALSRNFTRDIPVDGDTCEVPSCVDPVDADDDGHGSHVAGIIAAPLNGFGTAGVAPDVTLVNLRVAQDCGYFFLQPVLDGLTYGADIGLDVINMSFFVDPWRFNCAASPDDSLDEQIEQRTIMAGFQRALNYAHGKGVTLVSSMGNQHEDLGKPRPHDILSPGYPGATRPRAVDNATCLKMPAEGEHVLGVTALGPSQAKADRSDYGVERTDFAAPGGFFKDYFGTPWYETQENEVLSAYPRNASRAKGYIDANDNITQKGRDEGHLVKHCKDGTCAFYAFIDGTSMAAPHVSATAALTISQYGKPDPTRPGTLTMPPDKVEKVLRGTADKVPCPTPRTVSYEHLGLPAEYNATCEGDLDFNGFYGHGVVDAFAAVTRGAEHLTS
ncbi:S8 family peptidase [Lentzea xinjiangensis]|uniref:S8 family peptidase n=1 Tax=Lentzea xinjiangensis TaxID=402600 RepID=UPI001FEC9519|nr:S8 family serine peptidase [Lentzea xinjiangensis]